MIFCSILYNCYGTSMRILITGSSVFIAGYLIEELLKRDHEIVGIDNFSLIC